MSNKYEIQRGTQILGPFTSLNIKEMASTGMLNPDDLIRQVGTNKWARAGKVKSLVFSDQADTISEEVVQASVSTSSHISPTHVPESKPQESKSRLRKKVFLILGLVFATSCLLSILVPALNRANEKVEQSKKERSSQIKSETNQPVNNDPSNADQDNTTEVVGVWKDSLGGWSIRRNGGRYILLVVFNQDGSSLEYQLKKRSTPHGDRFDQIGKTEGTVDYWIINPKGNLETWDQDGFVDEIGTDGVVRERNYQDENKASTNLGKWQVLQPQVSDFTDKTSYAIKLPANNEIRGSFDLPP